MLSVFLSPVAAVSSTCNNPTVWGFVFEHLSVEIINKAGQQPVPASAARALFQVLTDVFVGHGSPTSHMVAMASCCFQYL